MIDFQYSNVGRQKEINSVILEGQLDTESCEYVLQCIDGQVENGCERLILDCQNLTFVSSIGLGMLIRVHSRMKKKGGDVKLACVQGAVADLIKLVKLDKVFQIYPSVDAAIAAHENSA